MSRIFPFSLRFFLTWISVLALVTACVTTGPGGKKSFLLIGSGEESSIGAEMNRQILSESKLLDDSLWQDYINEIGQRIVAVCDRKDIEYHFAVIESEQINAFALPGGYLYFYTGLLRLMDNEAQLASVVSHEVSHVVARHGMKRLQSALIAQIGYEIVLGGSKNSDFVNIASGIGLTLVFSGYSRSAEKEADRFGIYYMRQSGYDPKGAIGMFEHLAAAGERNPNAFEKLVASHPQTKERIRLAQSQIAEMGELGSDLIVNEKRYKQMLSRLPEPTAGDST